MIPVLVTALTEDVSAVHWSIRAAIAEQWDTPPRFSGALVTVEAYSRILDGAERAVEAVHGPRIPRGLRGGVGLRINEPDLLDYLPDGSAGRAVGPAVVHVPGRSPLALGPDECAAAIASVDEWMDSPQSSRMGAPSVGVQAHVWSVAAVTTIAHGWDLTMGGVPLVQCQHYTPSDGLGWHVDRVPRIPELAARSVSVVVMLSDPDGYEGGALEFAGGTVAPAEQGTVVVFPATTRHRVTPVTAGTRYTLTAFFDEDEYGVDNN